MIWTTVAVGIVGIVVVGALLVLQGGSVLEFGDRDSVLAKFTRGMSPPPVALASVRATEARSA